MILRLTKTKFRLAHGKVNYKNHQIKFHPANPQRKTNKQPTTSFLLLFPHCAKSILFLFLSATAHETSIRNDLKSMTKKRAKRNQQQQHTWTKFSTVIKSNRMSRNRRLIHQRRKNWTDLWLSVCLYDLRWWRHDQLIFENELNVIASH